VVFGNGGSIVRLAEKATVHDYLKISNTHVPVGAVIKVNGEVANMGYFLKDGDTIHVMDLNAQIEDRSDETN